MYDDLSHDYDRFVNWPARLAVELPFIERVLQQVEARRVLDAACGTGRHAIALAERGYQVIGVDLSPGMVGQARRNADRAGVEVRFEVAGLGHLHTTVGNGFDALLCLGNSLPHLITPADIRAALEDFAALLRPGGLVLIQNRNFDAVMTQNLRWMEPQAHRQGDEEWLFLRFYDFITGDLLRFNIVRLYRAGQGPWEQCVSTTWLRPLGHDELVLFLEESGLVEIRAYGDMEGNPFAPEGSPNLIVTARRAEGG